MTYEGSRRDRPLLHREAFGEEEQQASGVGKAFLRVRGYRAAELETKADSHFPSRVRSAREDSG